MAKRGPGRLSPLELRRLAKVEGLHADGGCLYLQVTRGKHGLRQSWIFMFALGGRQRSMGGGPLHTIGLAQAREWAKQQRQLRLQGIDPIEHRNAARHAAARESAKALTFDECRDRYHAEHEGKWRSAVHGRQWLSSMRRHVSPTLGKVPVKDVDLAAVIRTLEPLWPVMPETASRLRARIENVLDYAAVHGWRDRSIENPARWSLLSKKFASRRQLQPTKHLAAMKFDELPEFVERLRQRSEASAPCLEFAILTCGRSNEVRGARWAEIDLQSRTWEIPPDRMKSRRVHRVPLSSAAMAVLQRMQAVRQSEYVFPGTTRESISKEAVRRLMARMGRADVTPHGMRSCFSTWRAERTNFDAETAEACLAHVLASKTQAAYQRGTLFEKRRRVMDAWADYLAGAEPRSVEVTPLRAAS